MAEPRPGSEGGPPLLLRGARLVDEAGERNGDVLVVDGAIAAVEPSLAAFGEAHQLDCGGAVVAPGLVDLHTHLREPGGERAETVESGSRAAALGGFAAVVAMPNTEPAIDCAAIVRDVRAVEGAPGVAGAIGEMAELGVLLFTDDGAGVQDNALMRRSLRE